MQAPSWIMKAMGGTVVLMHVGSAYGLSSATATAERGWCISQGGVVVAAVVAPFEGSN